jgi:hypothetical protein
MPNSDAGKAETYVTVVIATQRLVRYVMSRRHALCNVFAISEASSIIGDPGCTFRLALLKRGWKSACKTSCDVGDAGGEG